jgi:hypothetical protein
MALTECAIVFTQGKNALLEIAFIFMIKENLSIFRAL